MNQLRIALLAFFLSPLFAQLLSADVISFRDVIASSTGIGVQFNGNTVTATGSIIYGNGYSATLANAFSGTLFENAQGLTAPSETTRLEGNGINVSRGDVDNLDNFVGFHVNFSSPIPLHDFYMTDIDGLEYGFSYALNGTSIIQPTVIPGDLTLPSPTLEVVNHDVDSAALDNAIANLTTGVDPGATAPTNLTIARALIAGNVSGDSPEGQVRFGYGGELVTDLFFGWGLYNNSTSVGTQRSGVTGFSVVESTIIEPVPEPSSLVFAFSLVGIALVRRRSELN